jgi:putative nucleotidyltransferase with HDIG domain
MNRQRALQLYIAGVAAAAALILAVCSVDIGQMPPADQAHWLPYAVFFVALGALCASLQVYFSDSSTVTMATVGQIATVITLPLAIALPVVGLGKGLSSLYNHTRRGRSWRSTVLNTGSSVLANAAGGAAFHALHGSTYMWSSNHLFVVASFPALAALGLFYYTVDMAIVTGAVTLKSGERAISVFMQLSGEALAPELSLIAVGIIFAILFHFSPPLTPFVVVPVYLSMRSFGAVARLRKETVEAVLKMAESIDYRDTGTYEHSERLATFCERLARALGLTPEHVREVVLASRVHDLGKIGISNEILLKHGPLTIEERRMMEDHPVIGAKILASYSSFTESVDIVRHHHERWDGQGYPDGIKGEEIPVGSRIITVVDSFDAMTSDRPYRKGMSVDEAVERLKAGMGSQFDPKVCAVFIQLLIEDQTYVPREHPVSLRLVKKEVS